MSSESRDKSAPLQVTRDEPTFSGNRGLQIEGAIAL